MILSNIVTFEIAHAITFHTDQNENRNFYRWEALMCLSVGVLTWMN